jgi:hypothetical protein
VTRGQPESCFGENEISASSISFLLLTTGHPTGFQPRRVRAFKDSYILCTLPMVRSLAFASTTGNSSRTFCTRFRFGSGAELLNLAARSNSRAHYAKGTRSGILLAEHSPPTACRYMVSGSFHSPNRGSFHHFRSRYWFAIGRQVVLSLRRWTARIQTSFHGAGLTRETSRKGRALSPTGLSPSVAGLSRALRLEPTFVTSAPLRKEREDAPTTPHTQRLRPWHVCGLGSFPFARRY